MPLGLNRTDLNSTGNSYANGSPITLPHNFGNPVTAVPVNNGNPIPTSGTEQNQVTWTLSPSHFGNIIGGGGGNPSGFELEDGSGVLLLETGDILLLEQQ